MGQLRSNFQFVDGTIFTPQGDFSRHFISMHHALMYFFGSTTLENYEELLLLFFDNTLFLTIHELVS